MPYYNRKCVLYIAQKPHIPRQPVQAVRLNDARKQILEVLDRATSRGDERFPNKLPKIAEKGVTQTQLETHHWRRDLWKYLASSAGEQLLWVATCEEMQEKDQFRTFIQPAARLSQQIATEED